MTYLPSANENSSSLRKYYYFEKIFKKGKLVILIVISLFSILFTLFIVSGHKYNLSSGKCLCIQEKTDLKLHIDKVMISTSKDTVFIFNDSVKENLVLLNNKVDSLLTSLVKLNKDCSGNSIFYTYSLNLWNFIGWIILLIILAILFIVFKTKFGLNYKKSLIASVLIALTSSFIIISLNFSLFDELNFCLFCFNDEATEDTTINRENKITLNEYRMNVDLTQYGLSKDTIEDLNISKHLIKVFDVYPFATGSNFVSKNQIDSLLDFFSKKDSVKGFINKVYILGGFDKRLLNDSLQLIFGSNIGLAQARIDTIKAIIQEHFDINQKKIIPIIKGPKNYKINQTEEKFSKDRSVRVIVEYNLKQRYSE